MTRASAVQVCVALAGVAYAGTIRRGTQRAEAQQVSYLALIYASVCAFRAVLPRGDVTKKCLIASPLSTPLVGRSLATLAEISLSVIVAKVLERALGPRALGPGTAALLENSPLVIVLAQLFCWTGCLSECEFWNAAEETLWGSWAAGLAIVCIWALGFSGAPVVYPGVAMVAVVLLMGYAVYMFTIDVPMYVERWMQRRESRKSGSWWASVVSKTSHLWKGGLGEALERMNTCISITSRYEDWKDDLGWFTGYFIGAVWIAIGSSLWYSKSYGASRKKLTGFLFNRLST